MLRALLAAAVTAGLLAGGDAATAPVAQAEPPNTNCIAMKVNADGSCSLTPISEPTLLSMPAVTPTTTEGPAATREELLALVNAERIKIGVAPLAVDERLHGSAQRKADDMTQHNYFGHTSPHDGTFGPNYVLETGIGCLSAGENLTWLGDVKVNHAAVRAVNAWMGSAPHREAILNARYVLIGFGISGAYVVEHFCLVR